ncbi:hypothetical protein N0V88_002191 [Collariella sp. IMI 366227]|nr:hypothetical protein N0V88_002191 [Collariella sp. IMI 366227]
MFPYPDPSLGKGGRAESVSSISGATTMSHRTMHSTEQGPESAHQLRPFVTRNGRTYLADPSLPYPLPVDLEEIHRQSLKTMLLLQLFGRPICSPAFIDKPPPRILDIGCGTGFWSMMCHRYYEARGTHHGMQFTGIDIVPLPPSANGITALPPPSSGDLSTDTRPEKNMNWRFVQHDLRKMPLPFPDESFDFVMVKDMGLAISMAMQQGLIEEYIRILTPGGTVEIWETDHILPRLLCAMPCTVIGPLLVQEAEVLTGVGSRRLAVPLSEIRWERRGWAVW